MKFYFMIMFMVLATPLWGSGKPSVFDKIKAYEGPLPEKTKIGQVYKHRHLDPELGFYVLGRTQDMERYPCSQCHNSALTGQQRGQKAHWDKKMLHPSQQNDCQLCHHKDSKELTLLNGTPLSFDQSYKLCAQCHGREFADWQGGAHGKKLGGWQAEKLVQNCTGCHDPHNPSFPVRKPATFTPIPFSEDK